MAGTAARSGGVYRKGIIREGRLVGVILLGVRRGEDGYRRMIEEGIDVEPLRRRLLDPEGDPLPDARGAPDSRGTLTCGPNPRSNRSEPLPGVSDPILTSDLQKADAVVGGLRGSGESIKMQRGIAYAHVSREKCRPSSSRFGDG